MSEPNLVYVTVRERDLLSYIQAVARRLVEETKGDGVARKVALQPEFILGEESLNCPTCRGPHPKSWHDFVFGDADE